MIVQKLLHFVLGHALSHTFLYHLLLHLDIETLNFNGSGGCELPILLGLDWGVWLDLFHFEMVHHLFGQLT